MVLTAIWLLVSSLGSYFHIHSFVKSATKAEGRAIRLVDGASPSIHYPVYLFRDADDRWHQVFTDVGTHPANYKVDDNVPLRYQANHPDVPRDSNAA